MNPFPNRTHFIVLPGGGYETHADHEAEPIVDWLHTLGISASAFRYPLHERHPAPFDAVRAEVRRLRATGIATVGVVGFSAGGHLAGHVALAEAGSHDARIDIAVLGYPITSMETATYRPAQDTLLGPNASAALRRQTSLDSMVTPSAPPLFIWHTAEDPYVHVEHSYRLASALASNGVPHALHVFSRGPHSLGLARAAGEASAWTTLAATWLRYPLAAPGTE